jgi:putative ABC transport system permease protein
MNVKRQTSNLKVSRFTFHVLAYRNLRAHAARTLLSALAVALGAAMLVATSVFRSGIEAAWTAGANKFAFITEISNLTFGGVGLMMLGAAGFLIYNAFAMSVTQQQRQIGLLRAVGMTRAQVLRLVLVEALFTGGLGTALGVLGGPWVGNGILNAMAYFGVETGQGSAAPGSIILAMAMGLGISLLSALIPARRAAELSPLEALRESASASPRVRAKAKKRVGQSASQQISKSQIPLSPSFSLSPSASTFGLMLLVPLWVYLAIAPPGAWTGYHQPWDYILSAVLLFIWWIGFVLVTPVLLGVVVRGVRAFLRRLSGGMGRLLGDNLGRAPERLHLTALTFAVGVMMLVSTGGFVAFGNEVMVGRIAAQALREQAWYIYPFNRVEGLGQLQGFQADAPALEPAVLTEIEQLAAGRAVVEPLYMVPVPEISSPFPGFPSLITLNPEQLTRPGRFHLVEGDWDTALPLLRAGCGVLVSPAIAARYGAGVGDPIPLTGRTAPVTCTVAATGAGGFAPMSLIGPGGFDLFVAPGKAPDSLQVRPLPESTDAAIAALDTGLHALAARYGADRVFISRPEDELKSITGTSDQLMQIMNGLLFLAIGAGALGSVNTTLVSILERRRELTLLRSLGATRRQIAGLIVGESALTGLLGALLGVLAGWGTIAIYTLTYGGVTFGLVDLPLWTAVTEVTWPSVRGGLPGLAAAPALAGLAAFLALVWASKPASR